MRYRSDIPSALLCVTEGRLMTALTAVNRAHTFSLENVPATLKARYTFEFKGADEYHELFELNEGDKGFQAYVAGRFLRNPPAPR